MGNALYEPAGWKTTSFLWEHLFITRNARCISVQYLPSPFLHPLTSYIDQRSSSPSNLNFGSWHDDLSTEVVWKVPGYGGRGTIISPSAASSAYR
jgi:hypothetical protein